MTAVSERSAGRTTHRACGLFFRDALLPCIMASESTKANAMKDRLLMLLWGAAMIAVAAFTHASSVPAVDGSGRSKELLLQAIPDERWPRFGRGQMELWIAARFNPGKARQYCQEASQPK